MQVSKCIGAWAEAGMVAFKLLDTSGTPSIVQVFPTAAAGDVSVVDTGPGIATVTIKNFKGPAGFARVFLTAQTDSNFVSNVTPAYTGDNFAFAITINNDASTATDDSVDCLVIAY